MLESCRNFAVKSFGHCIEGEWLRWVLFFVCVTTKSSGLKEKLSWESVFSLFNLILVFILEVWDTYMYINVWYMHAGRHFFIVIFLECLTHFFFLSYSFYLLFYCHFWKTIFYFISFISKWNPKVKEGHLLNVHEANTLFQNHVWYNLA